MNNISADEIKRLATMSALTLSDDEASSLESELNEILGYIKQLDEVDTENVEPTYQVTGLENVTRKDEIIDYNVSNEDLLKNAPMLQNNQIVVPKVL